VIHKQNLHLRTSLSTWYADRANNLNKCKLINKLIAIAMSRKLSITKDRLHTMLKA